MIGQTTRYALRSLVRNLRRTLLSVFGLAFGVGIGMIALSWIGGQEAMMVSAIARSGLGHLRVVPPTWTDRRDDALRLASGDDLLERVRATEGVSVATPRARVGGLLGLGTRSSHVALTGVDAATEPRACRYVSEVQEGRYLEPGERGAVVLGRTVADRLRARVGDELVVTSVDDEGEMQSILLEVVGIVTTGSRSIDGGIAHVALADVEQLSGLEGPAEISIILDDVATLATTRPALAALSSGGDEVISWREISPVLQSRLETGRVFSDIAVGVVLLVVLLGVASAQLTSVLERRKEFAVLAALGMRGFGLVRVVVTEGVLLGLAGALAALAWSGPITYRWASEGVNLRALFESQDDGIAFGGVLIEMMYYPSFGAWVVPTALFLSLSATIVASLYPAWFASRTDPAAALRVDR